MKKALSIILGGSLVLTSSIPIFAENKTSVKKTEVPSVKIDVLNETTDKIKDEIIIEIKNEDTEKELEEELLDLIKDILEELEDDDVDEDKDDDIEDDNDSDEDDDNDKYNVKANNQHILDNLNKKLLKYQLVYNRVPDIAKPAIEKNMKEIQLRIIQNMIKMNEDLNKLVPEFNAEDMQNQILNLQKTLKDKDLTEDEKKKIIDSITELKQKISNYEETVNLVEFIKENENWYKELKNKIHNEFKEEKNNIITDNKLDSKEIKRSEQELKKAIKEAKKEMENTIKSLDEKSNKMKENIEKVIEKTNNKNELKNSKSNKSSNEKIDKKLLPVKENNGEKGKSKNK